MRQHPKTPVLLTQSSRMLIEKMLHNSANVMQKQKEEERRAKRKKLFSGILGRDEDDSKPPKNLPPEF